MATTLLMGGNPSLVINPSLYDKLPFDPIKDFAPISQVFVAANVLAVPIELPVKTVAELVALAKAQPGKLSYAHAGVGTSQHLGAELFKYMAHLDIAAVPYRGSTALMPDLLAGRINMSFANIVNVLPLAREGKLRALAITSRKRSALAPDLPTMAESGFPGFEAVPWFGLLAPAGTPQDILDKLHNETVKALAMPEVRKKFDELGLEPIGNTPAEFAAVIRKETPEWAKVIKDAGIKLRNWQLDRAANRITPCRPRAWLPSTKPSRSSNSRAIPIRSTGACGAKRRYCGSNPWAAPSSPRPPTPKP